MKWSDIEERVRHDCPEQFWPNRFSGKKIFFLETLKMIISSTKQPRFPISMKKKNFFFHKAKWAHSRGAQCPKHGHSTHRRIFKKTAIFMSNSTLSFFRCFGENIFGVLSTVWVDNTLKKKGKKNLKGLSDFSCFETKKRWYFASTFCDLAICF